ncbi:inosine 5'-monophosphate dehydrogenase [Bacillus sp. THAF10]|uniref:DUF294 nucleotidyltransferase-like domain-containing protein n=1 Tax=Bacillus sp. THAF10 TaxID=2587848 RepID=UPI001268716E|nr:DUF294 nucleotidyltransferase-like domain-containing protein [Bacillus sp. THAF10]QFT90899.1 inosine 5'-monophosphate dehydrogenase [Bacillus sp. THAF10]
MNLTLSQTLINKLCQLCDTHHYKQDEIILRANENREGVFLVLSGMAEVIGPGHHEVIEIIKPHELIGLSTIHHFLLTQLHTGQQEDAKIPIYPDQLKAHHSQQQTQLQVRALDDLEALYLPYTILKENWDELRDYILEQVSSRLHDVYQAVAEHTSSDTGEMPTPLRQVHELMQDALHVKKSDSIQTVAEKLSADRQTTAAMVLDENSSILGIVTMHDFVNRVITTSLDTSSAIETIMTKNPITISRSAYYYEALTTMLLKGVKHLPVTSSNGELAGLVTLSNLLQANATSAMVKSSENITKANAETLPTLKEKLEATLATMLQQQVPILTTLDVMNTQFDRLVQRCVELSLQEMKVEPPSAFCFYLMGSGARKEQFLLTDQDHFLVYEKESDYFTELAEKIVRNLERAGFERCRGNMMASNPKWRGSLEDWEARIHGWTVHSTNDRLLLAQNFFSHRLVYGNDRLHQQFQQSITNSLDRAKIFLYRLSQLERENPIPTLEQPIRSMFRRNRKQIDMKKEVLFPYHHSLQILALMHAITYGTPLEKIDKLYEKKILSANFQKDLKASVATVLHYYVRNRHTQYQNQQELSSTLNLTALTTREKEELMLSIRLIKELQSHMLSYY